MLRGRFFLFAILFHVEFGYSCLVTLSDKDHMTTQNAYEIGADFERKQIKSMHNIYKFQMRKRLAQCHQALGYQGQVLPRGVGVAINSQHHPSWVSNYSDKGPCSVRSIH